MNKAQILFVGDFEKKFLKELGHESWEIKHCPDSLHSIAILEQNPIDLVVVRDNIDQLNGYQLCLLLKSHPQLANLPFIMLAEKKRKENTLDGYLFIHPNRIAEYSETVNKPHSLAKLIKEDLHAVHRQNKEKIQPSKPICLLPMNVSIGSDHLTNNINTMLLLERLVSGSIFNLLHREKPRTQIIKEFFAAVKSMLHVDLCGIAISSMHKPFLAFSPSNGLNQSSLDTLITKIKDDLILAEDLTIESPPQSAGKSGSTIGDLILVPIFSSGADSGMLVFAKYDNQKFSLIEKTIINYFELYTPALVEFLLLEQDMNNLVGREVVRVSIDPLTGLYNLEFLIGFLQQQLLFSFRNKLAVSLLMLDVDRFSQINDALGSAAGDAILAKLSEKLLSTLRASDLLARYSSDKFVVVLPNTEAKGARVLAEKLRLEIEQTNFFTAKKSGPSVTISIGCAQFDPSDLNPETILNDAKHALQRAKEAGRNKVAI